MTIPATLVRRLVASDLDGYKALRDVVLAAQPVAFTSDAAPEMPAESYRSRLGTERPEDGIFTLGALFEERVIGAITCERDGRAKVHHIGQLVGMMVDASARRKGIGRALLAACIAEARLASGLSMLTLTVTTGNASAVGLYERAGFRRYGRLERAIRVDGAFHAKDLMALTL